MKRIVKIKYGARAAREGDIESIRDERYVRFSSVFNLTYAVMLIIEKCFSLELCS